MKFKLENVKLDVPKRADEKSLDKKVKRWADRKAYGIDFSVRNGVVEVNFWMHTGLLKEDPKEFPRALKVLKRIVANSAPKSEFIPTRPVPPRWVKSLRGDLARQDPAMYTLERLTPMAKATLGTVRIEVGKNYNGSGAHAFGGASEWPVVDVHVPFQVGEEAKRLQFVQKLQKFIEENL